MSELEDLLEGMRGVYLRWLTAAFDDLRKSNSRFIAEAAAQLDGDLAREGPLSLPFRCDALVISRDGKRATPTFFPADRGWDFSPVEFSDGGVAISLLSCHWEAVRLAIWGERESLATAVKAWFEAAFEPAEERDDDQVQGVVHGISGFVVVDQVVTFTIDFGTAPVSQIFALLGYLRTANATRVELSMP